MSTSRPRGAGGATGTGCDRGWVEGREAGADMRVPHEPQKAYPGGTGFPQLGQTRPPVGPDGGDVMAPETRPEGPLPNTGRGVADAEAKPGPKAAGGLGESFHGMPLFFLAPPRSGAGVAPGSGGKMVLATSSGSASRAGGTLASREGDSVCGGATGDGAAASA